MIPTTTPSAAEKRWREAVREQGCIMCGPGPVEIHHVVGRTARHLKISIGHWFILPVSNQAHRVVERMPKSEQKGLFLEVCIDHIQHYGELPVPSHVLAAIMDWHR